MIRKPIIYILLVFSFYIQTTNGQLFNLTFGSAPNGSLTIPGPPMPIGRTDFLFSTSVCPPADSYTVVSGISQCYNNRLIPLYSDNTPFPDENGYMMLLHDVSHPNPKTIFEYVYNPRDICHDVDYQFSASIINLDKPVTNGCTRFSSFTLRVEDGAGNLVGETSTGDIQFAVNNMGYHFTKYFVNFRLPSTSSGLIVKIIDEAKAITTCTNTLAIDDIKLSVTGGKANIIFDQGAAGEWVKYICFTNPSPIVMRALVDMAIVNPAVQWQESADNGNTWVDIAGANSYTYARYFSRPGNYLFRIRAADPSIIINPNCGITSDLLKVIVDSLPKFHVVSNNSPVCAGQNLQFKVEGASRYTWSGPNNFYDNISMPHIYNSALKDSGWYYVTMYTNGGCSLTDSTFVRIIGTDVKAGPDSTICMGEKLPLNTSNGIKYEWSPPEGLSATNTRYPVASPTHSTLYTVKVTDSFGCTGTDQVFVKVANSKQVKADMLCPSFLCRNSDTIRFKDNSAGDITSWKWDFGNGLISSLQTPPLQLYRINNNQYAYTASLVVEDSAGCKDSIVKVLTVVDNCYLAVPSAFTPNADGLNDYLYPVNAYKAENLVFSVYNKAGRLLFRTNKLFEKWNGKYRGEDQPPGVYVWMLSYSERGTKPVFLKGTSLLIR